MKQRVLFLRDPPVLGTPGSKSQCPVSALWSLVLAGHVCQRAPSLPGWPLPHRPARPHRPLGTPSAPAPTALPAHLIPAAEALAHPSRSLLLRPLPTPLDPPPVDPCYRVHPARSQEPPPRSQPPPSIPSRSNAPRPPLPQTPRARPRPPLPRPPQRGRPLVRVPLLRSRPHAPSRRSDAIGRRRAWCGGRAAPGAMAEVKVKPEVPDPMDIENRIIELCHQFPHGITDQVIQNDMPHMEAQQRAMAINRLLSMGQLDLLRSNAGLLYRIKESQNASKMKGSDNQEKLVYQIIEDAGNKGIWSRDIRYKSNLPLTEINKILKNLESKKLIKAVKSVAASKKKVYMLYNLQPDRSVTGGAWYSDQDFESEFVEVLNQQCFKFLQSKAEAARESKQNPMIQRNSSFASSHEVWKYICELGISKVELSMEDIETILNTLIYDGKVEMTIIAAKEGTVGSVDGQMKLYRAVSPLIQPTGLVRTPCGLCPVFDDCHEGGEISPSNCIYMTEWLEF
uniref:DNA-directed RNA polymerase III subunit RPC6 n=5 Tax=Neoaves TaxID=3078114 RepID=A0A8C4UI53_FALTI